MVEQKHAVRDGWTPSDASRWLTFLTGGLLLAALALVAVDSVRGHARAIAAGDAALRRTARVAEALWEADASRIQALLARLRVELRTQARWTDAAAGGSGGAGSVPTRRTDTLLRRALEGMPELDSLELVLADQAGLSSVRIEPGAGPALDAEDEGERAARARALWYSDAVMEAVAANGRRVIRSPIEIERESGRALLRAIVALHEAGEVVQGALVATIDLSPLGSRLAALSTESIRFALVSAEGQPIGDSPIEFVAGKTVVGEEEGAHEGEALPAIVERGGMRRLVQPVPGGAAGRGGTVHFWIETDRPDSIAAALLGGPGSVLLVAFASLAGALSMARPAGGEARVPSAGGVHEASGRGTPVRLAPPQRASAARASRAEASTHEEGDRDPAWLVPTPDVAEGGVPVAAVRAERFVLREWLADVRGCLEREAASRGLRLVLRCERSLPREVEQDPLWLGGLIVSLGREALDSTSASRIALEVSRGEGTALRFELAAGETDLDPVEGMRLVAHRLGATLESPGPGRVALVVPHALA